MSLRSWSVRWCSTDTSILFSAKQSAYSDMPSFSSQSDTFLSLELAHDDNSSSQPLSLLQIERVEAFASGVPAALMFVMFFVIMTSRRSCSTP